MHSVSNSQFCRTQHDVTAHREFAVALRYTGSVAVAMLCVADWAVVALPVWVAS